MDIKSETYYWIGDVPYIITYNVYNIYNKMYIQFYLHEWEEENPKNKATAKNKSWSVNGNFCLE